MSNFNQDKSYFESNKKLHNINLIQNFDNHSFINKIESSITKENSQERIF